MTYTLVADIGGTRSRLARMQDGRLLAPADVYANREYSGIGEVLDDYLARQAERPAQMALAVAGPVEEHTATLTNLGWTISATTLADRYGIPHVAVINDFAAVAWATIALGPADTVRIGGGSAVANANRGVLGAGTGLGVSGLIAGDIGWAVLSGEGGHVTLPATTAEEAHIVAQITNEFRHCSAERVLSGPGLVRLYVASGGDPCAPEWVTQKALAGDDVARRAVMLFCAILGTVAGNLALTLGTRGGIYLAGGILPAIGELLAESPFRARFESHGRFTAYLADIPTYLITRPWPALVGLDIYLRRLRR